MTKVSELERRELRPGFEEFQQSGFRIYVLNPLAWEVTRARGWTNLWYQVSIQALPYAGCVTLHR